MVCLVNLEISASLFFGMAVAAATFDTADFVVDGLSMMFCNAALMDGSLMLPMTDLMIWVSCAPSVIVLVFFFAAATAGKISSTFTSLKARFVDAADALVVSMVNKLFGRVLLTTFMISKLGACTNIQH